MTEIAGKLIAILATSGFEQSELEVPRKRLKEAGLDVDIVAPEAGKIRGWKGTDWGDEVAVDKTLEEADPADYDALVLPGGVINPDQLRTKPEAVSFIQQVHGAGKPVAAICHGPWLLVEADLLRGRRATSYPSIRTDVENAGAQWSDEEVVADGGLITSRKPDDLDAFCDALLDALEQATKAA
ncbi:MAG: type 1 glutamine amidotransferase domain-containing protein [Rhodovibrionaceae bacterium]